MTRNKAPTSNNGEQCRNQMICCCLPCLLLWSTLEQLLKGCCVTSLYICSCQCFRREGINVIPYNNNIIGNTNEINDEINEEINEEMYEEINDEMYEEMKDAVI